MTSSRSARGAITAAFPGCSPGSGMYVSSPLRRSKYHWPGSPRASRTFSTKNRSPLGSGIDFGALLDSGEGDDAMDGIDRRDAPPRGKPRAESDDFHVAARPLRSHVLARVSEAIVPLAAGLFAGRNVLGDRIVAVPGEARAGIAADRSRKAA